MKEKQALKEEERKIEAKKNDEIKKQKILEKERDDQIKAEKREREIMIRK